LATDYRRINAAVRYEMFSVFQVKPGALGEDRAAAIVEARTYLDGLQTTEPCSRPWQASARLPGRAGEHHRKPAGMCAQRFHSAMDPEYRSTG
jgi:hypothetical protein